jgi:ATP-binding protein involved in chromosome partitioning
VHSVGADSVVPRCIFVYSDTGHKFELFGPSHTAETAQRLGIPFLGQLPINPQVARLCYAEAIEDYPGEEFIPIVKSLRQAVLAREA